MRNLCPDVFLPRNTAQRPIRPQGVHSVGCQGSQLSSEAGGRESGRGRRDRALLCSVNPQIMFNAPRFFGHQVPLEPGIGIPFALLIGASFVADKFPLLAAFI